MGRLSIVTSFTYPLAFLFRIPPPQLPPLPTHTFYKLSTLIETDISLWHCVAGLCYTASVTGLGVCCLIIANHCSIVGVKPFSIYAVLLPVQVSLVPPVARFSVFKPFHSSTYFTTLQMFSFLFYRSFARKPRPILHSPTKPISIYRQLLKNKW
jgi:hypothetical protein